MESEGLYIVFHDQKGRTSAKTKANARSITGKRTWAEKRSHPGQKTPRRAQKPVEADGEHDNFYVPRIEETVRSSRTAWNQSDLNKYIDLSRFQVEKKSLYSLSPPFLLKISEEMFRAVQTYTCYTMLPRLKPPFHDQTPSPHGYGTKNLSQRLRIDLPVPQETFWLTQGFINGLEALAQGATSRAFSCLEHAFQYVEKFLLNGSFIMLPEFIKTLIFCKVFNQDRIARVLLQHISRMAAQIHGQNHEITIWARNLHQLIHLDGVLDAVVYSFLDAIEDSLGPDDDLFFEMKVECCLELFKIRRDSSTVHDASVTYQVLLKECPKFHPLDRHFAMNLSHDYSSILVRHKQWEMARSVLSDAPFHLQEYISKKYHPGSSPGASGEPPIKITLIILKLSLLSKVLAAQNQLILAQEMLRRAIDASQQYLPRSHPTAMEVLMVYAKFLSTYGAEVNGQHILPSIMDTIREYEHEFTLQKDDYFAARDT